MKQTALSIEQVAAICGVSQERVRRWIEKIHLKAGQPDGRERRVNRNDLVDFLVQHNMPIPESIIPFQTKKILFVLSQEVLEDIFMQFVMRFFEQLKKEANFIIDYVSYGSAMKMKMIVFRPDLILLDVCGDGLDALRISQIVKSNDEYDFSKIIAITRNDVEISVIEQLISSGIDAVVPRSIELKSLIRKIKNLY